METEKWVADAHQLLIEIERIYEDHYSRSYNQCVHDIFNAMRRIVRRNATFRTVEVVQFNTLKSLVNGEWVDCKLVQEALGIDFGTGLKMFDFSRTVEWNPAPLNGQKTTTKFRLKNTEVHGRWIEKPYLLGTTRYCSICGQNYGMPHGVFNYCPNCGAKMDVGNEDG